MIDEAQALAMLRRHGMDELRVRHSRGVAMFAFRLASRIHRRHPELPLDRAIEAFEHSRRPETLKVLLTMGRDTAQAAGSGGT